MPQSKQNILFVINQRSGRKKTDYETIIKRYSSENGLNSSYIVLPKKKPGQELEKQVRKTTPQIVVAVGGDGTVSLVAHAVMGKNIKMAIIPAGSANGMARELEIPADPLAALDLIREGKTAVCDLVQVNNEQLCMHLSDLGLNARLVKYFQEGRFRGFLGYTFALLKALRRRNRFYTHISTPDGIKHVECMMVLFANASKYGTGATINHKGSLSDGLFEVIIVKKIGPSEIWRMFFGRRGFDPENIELHHARRVQVETTKPAHLQVDGEYLGKTNAVEARILEEKLEVFVPGESSEKEGGKS